MVFNGDVSVLCEEPSIDGEIVKAVLTFNFVSASKEKASLDELKKNYSDSLRDCFYAAMPNKHLSFMNM